MANEILKPSVGRIVHFFTNIPVYSNGDDVPVAAMITRVHSDMIVDLSVFPSDREMRLFGRVVYSPTGNSNCWRWPPRV